MVFFLLLTVTCKDKSLTKHGEDIDKSLARPDVSVHSLSPRFSPFFPALEFIYDSVYLETWQLEFIRRCPLDEAESKEFCCLSSFSSFGYCVGVAGARSGLVCPVMWISPCSGHRGAGVLAAVIWISDCFYSRPPFFDRCS